MEESREQEQEQEQEHAEVQVSVQPDNHNTDKEDIIQVEDGTEVDEWTFIETDTTSIKSNDTRTSEENISDTESIAIINEEQSSIGEANDLAFVRNVSENKCIPTEIVYDNSDSCSVSTTRECDEQLPENFCLREEKIRSYTHRRNKKVSSVLNVALICSCIITAGLAIGHMWGINDDCSMDMSISLRKILRNMEKLQKENELLKSQIEVLKMNRNMPQGRASLLPDKIINLNIVSEYDRPVNPYNDEVPKEVDNTLKCWEQMTISGNANIGPKTDCEEINDNDRNDDQNQTEPNEIITGPPIQNAPNKKNKRSVEQKEIENKKVKDKKLKKNKEFVPKVKKEKKQKKEEFENKNYKNLGNDSEWYLKMGKVRRQIRENKKGDIFDESPIKNKNGNRFSFAKLSDKAKWYFKRMDDREKQRHSHDEYKWSLNKKRFFGNIKSKW